MTIALFTIGIVLLIIGAESLVRGASSLAAYIGISPLIIGLTVVAFGTSSPELVVSLIAALNGNPDLAVGNVVGSNIFNVLFILGLSALVAPLMVSRQLIRLDVPVMIACSAALLLMSVDSLISRTDGILLFAGLMLYTAFLIVQGRKEKPPGGDEFEKEYGSKGNRQPLTILLKHTGFVAAGLFMLVVGSGWVVRGATEIALYLGVSELVVGLTIVSAGTSLPEAATSVVASLRGERDIAVGNIVGSNIFNILSVLGLSAIAAHGGIPVNPTAITFDIPVMTAATVACLPIFFTGHLISRWEGALFFAYYTAYILYLVLTATGNHYLPIFGEAMLFFVIPLTAVTLTVLSFRYKRGKR